MTLGNSPQPLTRRQLRELAREHGSAAAETASEEETASNDVVLPAGAPAAVATEPVSSQPVSSQPAASKPSSSKPAASKPSASKSAAAKPSVSKPAESKPSVSKPAESKPVDAKAVDAKAVDSKPADSKPVEAEPHHSRHTSVAPAPLPIPEAPPVADTGRTLTRRELRALQAASSASAAQEATGQEQVAPAPVSAPRSAPADDQPRTDAPAAVNSLHPPIGHWSVDREDDSHIETIGRRDDATFDDLVGRGVGAGGMPTTTNALILPSIPRQGPGGPITSTGEIMITGSIDLPRSLGATGQHPNLFDSSEMDRMLDQLDEGGHHNDVAPVSASRAVSTHTSTRGVMTPPRKRGASLPTVLAITAAVLAIGVLSLFVVGYAFNIY